MPDGEEVVSSTCLRFVAVAREAALRLIYLGPVNSATTEANTIVLEASITEAIAFAVGNTRFNSHIVRRQRRAEDESIGVTRAAILKAA